MKEKIQSVRDLPEPLLFRNISSFVFRGQLNSEWKLLPSILRLGLSRKEVEALEITLLEPYMKREVPHLASFDPIEYLMVLQHYGAPTKLMDWTSNLRKALFFACYDKEGKQVDKDGRIFLCDKNNFHSMSVTEVEFKKFRNPLNNDNMDEYMPRLMNVDTIKFVDPYKRNPRLHAQEGSFLCWPFLPLNEGEEEFVDLQRYIGARNKKYEEINKTKEHPEFEAFFVSKLVDRNYKQAILKELEEDFNISETTMLLNSAYGSNDDDYFRRVCETARRKAGLIIKGVPPEQW